MKKILIITILFLVGCSKNNLTQLICTKTDGKSTREFHYKFENDKITEYIMTHKFDNKEDAELACLLYNDEKDNIEVSCGEYEVILVNKNKDGSLDVFTRKEIKNLREREEYKCK